VWLIDVVVFLIAHRRLVLSLMVSAVIVVAGVATCRHLQNADRATAWMDAEFSPLGESIDEILGHEHDDLVVKVPGAIAYQIKRKIDRRGMKRLSEPERRFYAIYQLYAEARVRGFEAYFVSPAGENAAAARDGFIEIGAVRTAAVVERAMAVFPGGELPQDSSQRRAAITQSAASARPVWRECDEAILKVDDPLKRLLMDYVKKRKGEFVFR
jgi:hypothetical protein